jgi:branched-chain amino acid transport system substrate-binding protein
MKGKQIYVAMVISAVLILLVLAGVVWAQPKTPTGKTEKLTIGVSVAMSGPAAAWGQMFDRGCSLAVEDINSKGGVTVGDVRYVLQHKTFDHAYDPSRAVEIAKRMISVEKPFWVITFGTTATKPIIPFTEENKMLVMHAGAGKEIMIFRKQNYTYRSITGAPELSFVTWQWVSRKHPEWKTTVEMQPDDASGWEALKDIKEWILPRAGVKLVAERLYRRGITDFYPILVGLLGAKPDVFDLSNLPPADQGRILKQAREMGYNGPFIAPLGSTISPVLEIGGEHAEGLLFGANIDPTSRFATAEEKAFYDRFMKTYGPPYQFNTVEVALSVYVVAQAIEKANSLDPDKVTKIIQTAEFNVLGRKIKFGGVSVYGPPPRQVILPWGIFVVEKGKPKMIDIMELPVDY